ncbi:MAG: exodeoxyribonuclease VII small subunit [Clostridia bacterium]|nr:exodeoxyribonuclease VII small subunit [Clostridia bacterium]
MRKIKNDFETNLKTLEEIVEKLESGEETLENSLALYEKGMEISNVCKEMLEKAEQKITVIDAK